MTSGVKSRGAFTLVEILASIVVISVVAAVVLPVITGATDTYSNAATTRRAAERGSYAMERTIRLLRDTPEGVTTDTVGISTAAADSILFTDGRGLSLSGTTLSLRDTDGTTAALCEDVTTFTITYFGEDGVTSTIATPNTTQRYNITIVSGGFELRSSTLARVRAMGV